MASALDIFLMIAFAASTCADQIVGPSAHEASRLAGITEGQSPEEKLIRALMLINVRNIVHEKTRPHGGEPLPPVGGTHPYEWDSLRSAEQMLKDRDGGSCGTHGLSLAAVLRASGIASDDVQILSMVNGDAYSDICPGKAGERRKTSWTFLDENGKQVTSKVHPGNGHVFLAYRINGKWRLVNTTHDPFQFPLSKQSSAYVEFGKRVKQCAPKDRLCVERARLAASSLLTLEDFEMIPLRSIDEIDLSGKSDPTLIDVRRFPSLIAQMKEGQDPDEKGSTAMVLFNRWSFEQYPRHTIRDRMNMIASGRADSDVCRWSSERVMSMSRAQEESDRTEISGSGHSNK